MRRLFLQSACFLATALFFIFPNVVLAGLSQVTVSDAAGLQAALMAAETDPNDTVINLDPGTYSNVTVTGTFAYSSALNKNLTLQGSGMGSTILDGGDTFQVVNISHTGSGNTVTLQDMTIQHGRSLAVNGGGLRIFGTDLDIFLERLEISENIITTTGRGAAFNLENLSGMVSVNQCLFEFNEANGMFSTGGAGFIYGEDLIRVTNSIFYKNLSNTEGGGLETETPSAMVQIINNTFVENTAGARGGGVFLDVFDMGAQASVYNNIFYANSANAGTDAGDDVFGDNDFSTLQAISLFNNLFAQACFTGGNCDPATANGVSAGNNINGDPLLIDPAGGDFNLGQGSHAIDAGVLNPPGGLPSPDYAGNPRPIGSSADLGALEALPLFQLSPNPVNFGTGSVGIPLSQEVLLSNQGTGSVMISGYNLSANGDFNLNELGGSNPCGPLPFILDGGDTCTVEVTWNPTGSGNFQATIEWFSDDPNNPNLVLTVTGNVNGSGNTVGGSGCAVIGDGNTHALGFLPLWLAGVLGLLALRLKPRDQ